MMIINTTQAIIMLTVLKDSLKHDSEEIYSITLETRLALYKQIVSQQSKVLVDTDTAAPEPS